MNVIRIIKIVFIVLSFLIAILIIIYTIYDYDGKLFVLDHPSPGGFAVHNALAFFSIFILMALLIYAINKIDFTRNNVYLVNAIIFLVYLYNTVVVAIFVSSSVRLHIRSLEPGANVGGYFDSMFSLSLFIMSVIIMNTAIFQGRWLLKIKKNKNE